MNLLSHYHKPVLQDVIGENIASAFPLLKTVWAVGAIIIAVYFIYAHLRALRIYMKSLPLDTQFIIHWMERHYLHRDYRIKKSDQILSPLTYGLIKPVILIPKITLTKDTKEMEYVLLHEWIHIKKWDILRKWALVMVLCIHWFNPLVWAMFILANRDIELCCDEKLLRIVGEDKKKEYANLLINMEEKRVKLNHLCLGFGNNHMRERIEGIMKIKKVSMTMIILSIILIIGVTTVFGTSSIVRREHACTRMPLMDNDENMDNRDSVVNLIPNLLGKTYEEACLILQRSNFAFTAEKVYWEY